MDINNRANETLLDFSDIFWGFIDQWKAVILFSLIISIIVTGLKYKRDSDAYTAAITAAKENPITAEVAAQRINETLDALSDEDRSAVNFALGFYSLLSDKYKYQAESPIMSVDPNHTEILTITYRITGDIDPSLLTSLNEVYITAFNDHVALEAISDATSAKIAPDYIKELISFSDPYTALSQTPASIIQEDNTFTVYVIIPKNESSELIEGAITDVLKKKSHEYSASIAPHTIETVSVTSSATACNSVLTKQSDIYYSSSYLKSSLDGVVSGFNPQQSEAYNLILQLQSAINDNGGEAAGLSIVPEPAKPTLSKKAMVLGFVPGIFLYLFAFIICLIFSYKTGSAKIAKKITHKRLLGEFYQNTAETSILGKLLHSPTVFNLWHRGKTDLEKQAEEVSQSLDVIAAREGLENILIVNTYSGQDTFTDSIKKACSADDLSISVLQQDDINDEAFKDVTDAVLSVSTNTRVKNLYELIDLLNYYRINILGFIFTTDH